jgi:hydroxyacylglutathione hydrolase
VEARHTPGHTPEHVCFLVTDTPAAAGPWGILTGDFVFVGDVGRPDLLEKAAGIKGTMEAGAHTLFRSLQRFRALPDHRQVWPGHGAGSACGKALGAIASTTVGYEKIANWGVGTTDEDEFVRMVLDGQPEPPRYFAEMKRINKEGPRILGERSHPVRLSPAAAHALVRARAAIVDTRPAAAFAAGHLPGTLNIPMNESFTTWAGWLLPYDQDIYVLVEDGCPACADTAVRDLAMIGLDRVAGIVGEDALAAWTADGHPLGTVAQRLPAEVAEMLARGEGMVVDVRGHAEWEAGHLPGVRNIPVGHLTAHLAELRTDGPLVVQCQSGARSAIAASVLQAHGIADVANLVGGYTAWRAAGLPVTTDGAEPAGATSPPPLEPALFGA